jgi:hypothetical protein
MKNIFATMSGIAAGGLLIAMGVAIGYSTQHPAEANEIARINSMMPAPLPQATKTIQVQGKTKVETKVVVKKVPTQTLTCAWGKTEDSCYADYIGKGKWVLRKGEAPKVQVHKAPGASIAGVCRNPKVTKGMLADCNKKAHKAAEYVAGKYGHPKGEVLVRECLSQYTGEELAICLR